MMFGGRFRFLTADEYDMPNANFNSFLDGYTVLFQLFVGEAWNGILHAAIDTGGSDQGPWVVVYYFSYTMILTIVFSNLLIGVVISGYSAVYDLRKGQPEGGKIATRAVQDCLLEGEETQMRMSFKYTTDDDGEVTVKLTRKSDDEEKKKDAEKRKNLNSRPENKDLVRSLLTDKEKKISKQTAEIQHLRAMLVTMGVDASVFETKDAREEKMQNPLRSFNSASSTGPSRDNSLSAVTEEQDDHRQVTNSGGIELVTRRDSLMHKIKGAFIPKPQNAPDAENLSAGVMKFKRAKMQKGMSFEDEKKEIERRTGALVVAHGNGNETTVDDDEFEHSERIDSSVIPSDMGKSDVLVFVLCVTHTRACINTRTLTHTRARALSFAHTYTHTHAC